MQLYQQKTESEPTSEDEEDEEDEKKWRPLPPPNMESLLRRIPPTPMTLEELCAPSSDEEEDEREKIEVEREKIECGREIKSVRPDERVKNGSLKQVNAALGANDKLNPAPPQTKDRANTRKESKTPTCSTAATNSTDPLSYYSHLQDQSMPPPPPPPITAPITASFTDGCFQRKSVPPRTVSDYIKITNHQSSVDSKQHMTSNKWETEGVPSSSVIDLTEQSLQEQPSTSGLNNASISRNPTFSNLHQPSVSNNPALQKDPYELADEDDDFDVLCLDVDLSTIDDFSDSESELTETVEPRDGQTSQALAGHTSQYNTEGSIICGKGKGRASPSDHQTTASPSDHQTTASPSDHQTTASLSDHQTNRTYTGVKRPNDFHDNSRSKQPRLERYGGINSNIARSGSRVLDTGDKFPSGTPTSHRTMTHGTSIDTREKQNSNNCVAQSTQHGGVSHGFISNPMKNSRESTACDTRPQPISRPQPVTGTASSTTRGASGTTRVASDTTSGASGTTSSVGRTTPLGSRLTTDNCPMCNTRFPSW